MNKAFIGKYWYAYIYEQLEKQTNDVEFLIKVIEQELNGEKQNILEVACGGGRISVPLAKAGHMVTGFDADEYMLLRCYMQSQHLPNLTCYQADAILDDWGSGFDIIILGGNLLINIESEIDYAAAQITLIEKAAKALRVGGYLFLDFDLHANPEIAFNVLKEGSYFSGIDDLGTMGRTVSYGSVYNPVTQICTGTNHLELKLNNEELLIISKLWYKHIPTQAQVYSWLENAGFIIDKTFENYTNNRLENQYDKFVRATIWARKQ